MSPGQPGFLRFRNFAISDLPFLRIFDYFDFRFLAFVERDRAWRSE